MDILVHAIAGDTNSLPQQYANTNFSSVRFTPGETASGLLCPRVGLDDFEKGKIFVTVLTDIFQLHLINLLAPELLFF